MSTFPDHVTTLPPGVEHDPNAPYNEIDPDQIIKLELIMSKQQENTERHYFASCGLGWATATTRAEAIEKLARSLYSDLKPWILNCIKANEPGVYVWSCKVLAPPDAQYKIDWFQPVGIVTTDHAEHFYTRITQTVVNYFAAADVKCHREHVDS